MRLLIVDNFDSFTYNLYHYAEPYCTEVKVLRNTEIGLTEMATYDKIMLSPGPGLPSEVPLLSQIIDTYKGLKPILGVCLGMQAIVEYYGGVLHNMPQILHGKPAACQVVSPPDILFTGVSSSFQAGRYHSWGVNQQDVPKTLRPTALGPDNLVMAVRHESEDICGVQFHPESVLTPQGQRIIQNWLED